MSNQKVAAIGIVFFTIVSVVIYAIWPKIITPKADAPTPNQDKTIGQTQRGFTLEANYVGTNTWEYELSAELPDPCTKVEVDTLIAESFPEQVTIRVKTSKTAEFCAQVIAPYISLGTFSASERASISLEVDN